MEVTSHRKKLLAVYAVVIIIICFLAVPDDYYLLSNSPFPFPEKQGYQSIWVSRLDVSFQPTKGVYSSISYNVKINAVKAWLQIFGITVLFSVAYVILGSDKKDDSNKMEN
ncbi:hypothetical protein [Paenibacillus sp. Soil724D2]|uniref:hypothetical protein n=1 Tax=Paenibacillus sp. (strain Soil724D2) TaxID=1736392 RepID=UPI000715E97D|nr:hypothetical protein [Paenibacillus sp. Soil724D2]KRE50187.1 hypothetical protein ASG85_22350 [Paenibacillus sp. Soil724D2]